MYTVCDGKHLLDSGSRAGYNRQILQSDMEPQTARATTVRIRSASDRPEQVVSDAGTTKSARPAFTKRNSMGEYIVPEGQPPLTAQGYPTPSGFDYNPSTRLSLPKTPEFTIKGQLNPLTKPQMPSPSDYNAGKDLSWKGKDFTFKKKDVTWPYDNRKDAHVTCSPGAATYKLTAGDVGSAQKKPCSAKHKGLMQSGPPNSLVQPCDTEGFATPGPSYWPRPDTGTKSSMGIQLNKSSGETLGPGPAAYTLPVDDEPAPLIAELVPELSVPHAPGPDQYVIASYIGTGAKKTIGQKYIDRKPTNSPAPNHYKPNRHTSSAAPSLTYRAFPVAPKPHPGPADHSIKAQTFLPHNPNYSCKETCRPVFPDILLYTEYKTLNVPDPGCYEPDREFKDNSKPSYSVGLPLPKAPNTNPGPNRYKVDHTSRSNHPKAPQYSMGRRQSESNLKSKSIHEQPGPADYVPRKQDRPQSCKIVPRRQPLTKPKTPSANDYRIESNQTRKGQSRPASHSMKGRPSPFVYSGFSNVAMHRCSSLV